MFLQASLPPSTLPRTHTQTHTHAGHSAWENTMQCGNAWLILIRSSLFFITWFPSASKLAAPFFSPRWWNLLSAFRGSGERWAEEAGWRRGGTSALDGFNGQRIMPIYVCTVIKKNERMERAKASCRGRYLVISGIKKKNLIKSPVVG